MRFSLRLPWTKSKPEATEAPIDPATCTHPRLDVELVGTVVKRRWCVVCGKDLTEKQD
jgi:hypothetical protein